MSFPLHDEARSVFLECLWGSHGRVFCPLPLPFSLTSPASPPPWLTLCNSPCGSLTKNHPTAEPPVGNNKKASKDEKISTSALAGRKRGRAQLSAEGFEESDDDDSDGEGDDGAEEEDEESRLKAAEEEEAKLRRAEKKKQKLKALKVRWV